MRNPFAVEATIQRLEQMLVLVEEELRSKESGCRCPRVCVWHELHRRVRAARADYEEERRAVHAQLGVTGG